MTREPHAAGDRLRAAARERGVSPDALDGPAGAEGGDGAGGTDQQTNDASGVAVSKVPTEHEQNAFAVEGLSTRRDERLLEALLADREGVSAASAAHRNGTVQVHHDPGMGRETLRQGLTELGLAVDPGDAAFETRRAGQFAKARVAVAVLFGLMVVVPYVGVLYPTRVEWLFYDPATVAYLQSLLDSSVATHFYVNLAALSGVAFLVACGPAIGRARAALAAGRLTRDLVFVSGVVGVHLYSTLAAFTAFGGGVHYDLVAYAVVGHVLLTHVLATPADAPAADGTVAEDTTAGARHEPDAGDADEVALTDGGR